MVQRVSLAMATLDIIKLYGESPATSSMLAAARPKKRSGSVPDHHCRSDVKASGHDLRRHHEGRRDRGRRCFVRRSGSKFLWCALEGTNVEEGNKNHHESAMNVLSANDSTNGVSKIVNAVRESNPMSVLIDKNTKSSSRVPARTATFLPNCSTRLRQPRWSASFAWQRRRMHIGLPCSTRVEGSR